jgi:hypothetical protein
MWALQILEISKVLAISTDPGYDIAGTVGTFDINELRGERALDTHTNY